MMTTVPNSAKRRGRGFGSPPSSPLEEPKLIVSPELFEREKLTVQEAPKRGRGRPREKVMGNEVGFATRVRPETITDIKAITDGLRLRSQGDTIERAVALLKQHLRSKVTNEFGDMNVDSALALAYKVD